MIGRNSAISPRIRDAAHEGLELIMKPPQWHTDTEFILARQNTIASIYEPPNKTAHCQIAGRVVFDVLPHVPPLKRRCEVGQFGCLAEVSLSVLGLRVSRARRCPNNFLGTSRLINRLVATVGIVRQRCLASCRFIDGFEPSLLPKDQARSLTPAVGFVIAT